MFSSRQIQQQFETTRSIIITALFTFTTTTTTVLLHTVVVVPVGHRYYLDIYAVVTVTQLPLQVGAGEKNQVSMYRRLALWQGTGVVEVVSLMCLSYLCPY